MRSKAAKLLSTALAGHVTSPEPHVTAVRGLQGVPRPVIVEPSTDILTIGLAGSVLSVSNHVTVSTEPPPPPHVANSRPVSSALTFANLPACQA